MTPQNRRAGSIEEYSTCTFIHRQTGGSKAVTREILIHRYEHKQFSLLAFLKIRFGRLAALSERTVSDQYNSRALGFSLTTDIFLDGTDKSRDQDAAVTGGVKPFLA